ncbi:MAG: S8 family serine peptidase [Planctomycetota bacterium]
MSDSRTSRRPTSHFSFLPLVALLAVPFTAAGPQERAGTPDEPVKLVPAEARATGRWIVHLAGDPAANRAELRAIAAARREGDAERVAKLAGARDLRLAPSRSPIAEFVESHGGRVVATTWLADTLAFEGGDAELPALLASRDDVRLVQADTYARAQLEIATDASHHASDAANQLTGPGNVPLLGTGVTLAIVDSGIDADHAGSGRAHAAFFPGGDPQNPVGPGIGGSRVLSAGNFSAFFVQPAEDTVGHGTRVASIAAGAMFNTLPEVDDGPAPNAAIRSYKISDDAFGSLASTISMDQAFQRIVLDVDVRVANMSYDGTANPLASPNVSIEAATLADVLVTLSAGNLGANLAFAHGCYNAITVGASRNSAMEPLDVPGFVTSAIGPLPDGRTYPQVLAVGEALTCAKLDDESSSIDSWGTSGASALVAGSAVLVRQADPGLSALGTKALLLAASDEVVLGPAGARGHGYLRTDRACEAALAGLVVEDVARTGILKRHPRFLHAGDDVRLALVWNRESPGDTTIDDLDLRVKSPLGQILEWSASAVDNVELLRFTAPVDGVYEVQVLPVVFDGDGEAVYALAGVDTPSIDPSACAQGPPQVLSQSPGAIPTLVQGFDPALYPAANTVVLQGCNFSSVTDVRVENVSVAHQIVDDHTLTFRMPIPNSVGQVPITLVTATGQVATTVHVVPADDVLNALPNIVFGSLTLWLGGTPGDLFVLAYSPSLQPSVVPGVIDADIGAQFTAFAILAVGVLPPNNGVATFTFTNVPGITGQYFHFQAVTLDPTTFLPPWRSSNVATSIYTH